MYECVSEWNMSVLHVTVCILRRMGRLQVTDLQFVLISEKVEALFKILRATGCFLFMGSAINSIQWAMKETVMGLTAGVKLTCHKLCVIS